MNVPRRMLFVDDEPMVLQGLQRSLRHLRRHWDMAFVTSGAEALALMELRPFDVVISDMRMPGMSGAALLNEVMKRHPGTLRLILSGYSDKDLILKCVGSTHQFLCKPCQPGLLEAALLRASALGQTLDNARLKQLVSQMSHVPSLPSAYAEITTILQDERADLGDVARVVERDLGMTAEILKLVNSAFFGLRREIVSVAEAVRFLGLDTIKSLVLSLHAFAQFNGAAHGRFSLDALWAHSLATAIQARRLVEAEAADLKLRDEAFVAGLLHDIGKVVLASNFTEQYDAIELSTPAEAGGLVEVERAAFGTDHAGVGGYLLGLWGLPVTVVEAIALHHEPRRATTRDFSPLAAVHLADLIEHGRASEADQLYLHELGWAKKWEEWRSLRVSHPESFPGTPAGAGRAPHL
jgi:HD-like signal output (HDOD) protein